MAQQHALCGHDTNVETKKVANDELNLREFLKNNKWSDKAMAKLDEDLSSGDLTIEVLCDYNEQELKNIAKECNLSTAQTKGLSMQ